MYVIVCTTVPVVHMEEPRERSSGDSAADDLQEHLYKILVIGDYGVGINNTPS